MYCQTHSFNSEHPQHPPLLVLVGTVFGDAQEFLDVVLVQFRVRQAHLAPYGVPVAVLLYVQLEVVRRTRRPESVKLRRRPLLGQLVVLLGSLDLPDLVVLTRGVVEKNVAANGAQGFRGLNVL